MMVKAVRDTVLIATRTVEKVNPKTASGIELVSDEREPWAKAKVLSVGCKIDDIIENDVIYFRSHRVFEVPGGEYTVVMYTDVMFVSRDTEA